MIEKKNENGINNRTKRETLIALISPVLCREDASENRVRPPLNPQDLMEYQQVTILVVV